MRLFETDGIDELLREGTTAKRLGDHLEQLKQMEEASKLSADEELRGIDRVIRRLEENAALHRVRLPFLFK